MLVKLRIQELLLIGFWTIRNGMKNWSLKVDFKLEKIKSNFNYEEQIVLFYNFLSNILSYF